MAAKPKPHRLIWAQNVKDLAEVNKRLTDQLHKTDQMLETLFKAVADLTARVEALE